MALTKKSISPADIEAQTALELPDRETLTCGNIYVVKIDDSFNQYVLNNLTLQQALTLCNFANQWNINLFNIFAVVDQQNNGWFKCQVVQESQPTLIN